MVQAAARTADAARARAEAEALARAAVELVADRGPAADAARARSRQTFGARRRWPCSIRRPDGAWDVDGSARAPPSHHRARTTAPPSSSATSAVLVLARARARRRTTAGCATALGAQLAAALERRRLQAEAADAAVAGRGRRAADRPPPGRVPRPAHPAGLDQGAVTSLLQHDIDWRRGRPPPSSSTTIDEETDRLDVLVGNLLDMSRLQSGASASSSGPVGCEEVVAAAAGQSSAARPMPSTSP